MPFCTISWRAGVDPARSFTASWTSKRNAFASARTSLKRCSARSRSARATRACQAMPMMPATSAMNTAAAAVTAPR